MERGANKNMAFEYTIKVEEVNKIRDAIEEIYIEFKKIDFLSNAIKECGTIILPSDGSWDRWLELEELEGEIYYWSTEKGYQLDIVNSAIANALNRLHINFTIEEE